MPITRTSAPMSLKPGLGKKRKAPTKKKTTHKKKMTY